MAKSFQKGWLRSFNVDQARRLWIQNAHTLFCHPVPHPLRSCTFSPITLKDPLVDTIVEKVHEILLLQGQKNLLGSVHENLKKLVPLILEEKRKLED